MDDLRLSAHRRGPLLTIAVTGDLDLATKPDLVAFYRHTIRDIDRRIDLDLLGLSFIDATGLGALIYIRNHARQQGAHLVLTNSGDRLKHLLAAAHLEGLFNLT